MKPNISGILTIVFLSSSFVMANAFDGICALGIIAQFSGNTYPLQNEDLKIYSKNYTLSYAKEDLVQLIREKDEAETYIIENDLVSKGVSEQINIIDIKTYKHKLQKGELGYKNLDNFFINRHFILSTEEIPSIKESLEFLPEKNFSTLAFAKNPVLAGGFGVKIITKMSKNWLFDMTILAKKEITDTTLVVNEKTVTFKTEDSFKNIATELNLGFLYNIINLSDTAGIYAGVGGAICYQQIDKHLKEPIYYNQEDDEEIESLVNGDTRFNKGSYDGGIYATTQVMYKPKDHLLMGIGLKLHINFFNSPFGDVSDIQDIKNTNLLETGFSGLLYITYVV